MLRHRQSQRRRCRDGVRTRGAVLEHPGAAVVVEELELARPGPGEVLVRLGVSGVCHSDFELMKTGDALRVILDLAEAT